LSSALITALWDGLGLGRRLFRRLGGLELLHQRADVMHVWAEQAEPDEAHAPAHAKGHDNVPWHQGEHEAYQEEEQIQRCRRAVAPRKQAMHARVPVQKVAEKHLHRPQDPRRRVERIHIQCRCE